MWYYSHLYPVWPELGWQTTCSFTFPRSDGDRQRGVPVAKIKEKPNQKFWLTAAALLLGIGIALALVMKRHSDAPASPPVPPWWRQRSPDRIPVTPQVPREMAWIPAHRGPEWRDVIFGRLTTPTPTPPNVAAPDPVTARLDELAERQNLLHTRQVQASLAMQIHTQAAESTLRHAIGRVAAEANAAQREGYAQGWIAAEAHRQGNMDNDMAQGTSPKDGSSRSSTMEAAEAQRPTPWQHGQRQAPRTSPKDNDNAAEANDKPQGYAADPQNLPFCPRSPQNTFSCSISIFPNHIFVFRITNPKTTHPTTFPATFSGNFSRQPFVVYIFCKHNSFLILIFPTRTFLIFPAASEACVVVVSGAAVKWGPKCRKG